MGEVKKLEAVYTRDGNQPTFSEIESAGRTLRLQLVKFERIPPPPEEASPRWDRMRFVFEDKYDLLREIT